MDKQFKVDDIFEAMEDAPLYSKGAISADEQQIKEHNGENFAC